MKTFDQSNFFGTFQEIDYNNNIYCLCHMIQSTHVRKNKNEAKSLRQGALYLTVAECTPVVVLVGYFEALGGEQFIFQQFIFLHKYIYGQQINL